MDMILTEGMLNSLIVETNRFGSPVCIVTELYSTGGIANAVQVRSRPLTSPMLRHLLGSWGWGSGSWNWGSIGSEDVANNISDGSKDASEDASWASPSVSVSLPVIIIILLNDDNWLWAVSWAIDNLNVLSDGSWNSNGQSGECEEDV